MVNTDFACGSKGYIRLVTRTGYTFSSVARVWAIPHVAPDILGLDRVDNTVPILCECSKEKKEGR